MTEVSPLGTVEMVPIKSIRPAETNPRKITPKAVAVVAESLKEFGWQQPIIVDKDGVILAGHTRHRAATILGLRHVPVIVAEGLTEEQARAYRIADNRTGDFTSWDFPELARELEELGDFSEVLGLADWESVMNDYHDSTTLTEEENTVTDEVFRMTVVTFADEETALAVAEKLFYVDGVIDVRHKR